MYDLACECVKNNNLTVALPLCCGFDGDYVGETKREDLDRGSLVDGW